MSMREIFNCFGLTLVSLGLVACASTPKKTGQVNLDRPSRSVHVEGVTSRSLDQSFSSEPCVAGTSLKGRDWKTLVRVANGCLKVGNWKAVEEVGQYLARTDLESPWGAYYMGLVAEKNGDVPRALWMVDLALKKSGGSVSLFRYQRGRLLWALKEYDTGFAEVKAAVKSDGSLLEGHLFLADVYARDMDADAARRHYQEALELAPGHSRAKRGLASLEAPAEKPADKPTAKKE